MNWVDDSNSALLVDLYELTMADSYFRRGMNGISTFDMFVRDLPPQRNFLISCGLEQALDYLEDLHFEEDALEYLGSLDTFDDRFLSYLEGFRFSGEVWAIPEGELTFGREPLLRVTAPLIEAQIVETFLINCLCFQTMVASKAARISIACRDRSFVDFSPRRDHGGDAALKAARASYIGGAKATSNVLAGKVYGLPVTGTMAHSYVMTFPSERDAFAGFLEDFPDKAMLLIDTFDIERGAQTAVEVARSMNTTLVGVRIDSGNLGEMARSVRRILDDAGMHQTQIVLSGDMNEYRIASLLAEEVPVDSFGVGTEMGTSADAPNLGGAYKLVADDTGPKIKLSAGKATLPGEKQIYRCYENGTCRFDLLALEDEETDLGRPILEKVMVDGKRLLPRQDPAALQERCRRAIASLPNHLRSLHPAEDPYPVRISDRLEQLVSSMTKSRH